MRVFANKKGMTMIELVVGTLLFALLATTISLVMAPTLQVYSKANELAEINTLMDNLSAELVNDISRASGVRFGDQEVVIATETGVVTYSIGTADPNKGLLLRGDTPVLERGYYKNKTVSVAFFDGEGYDFDSHTGTPLTAAATPHAIVVQITVSTSEKDLASREYAVKPLGLNQY